MTLVRISARFGCSLITLLLALIWLSTGAISFTSILYDVGTARTGDAILAVAHTVGLDAASTIAFARMLAGIKLGIGILLLLALMSALLERVRFGACEDSVLEVALFVSAVASAIAGIPLIMAGGHALTALIGEFIFCLTAYQLAAYSRRLHETKLAPTCRNLKRRISRVSHPRIATYA